MLFHENCIILLLDKLLNVKVISTAIKSIVDLI